MDKHAIFTSLVIITIGSLIGNLPPPFVVKLKSGNWTRVTLELQASRNLFKKI